MIKVLVVEDSLMFRELLVKHLNQDPELQVVAVASDPFEARDAIIKHNPDVMTLDVELPKMDGIEFLQKLMPQYPLRTIMVSSLSEKVFDALKAGAVDFVVKPKVTDRGQLENFLSSELPGKVKIAAAAKLRTSYDRQGMPTARSPHIKGKDNSLVIAIGASTGGTEATTEILKGFGSDLPGVIVTQHMPSGFTKMYAERLDQKLGLQVRVKEAQTGDVVRPGQVLIAPGGEKHMMLTKVNGEYQVVMKYMPKVNGHCPSVDVLFDSVAKVAGDHALGVILTGMGGDGAKGLLSMRQAGAMTVGQDESTCVVYGMPKVAYEMGAVGYQEKLSDIPKRIYSLVDKMQRTYS